MSVRHPVRVVEQPAGPSRFVSSRGCTHPARRTSSLAQIFGRLRHGRKGQCRLNPLLGISSMTEAASSAPIAMLKMRRAREDRSARWMTAPKASHTKHDGKATSAKITANVAAWR